MYAILLPRTLYLLILVTWNFLVVLISADDIRMLGPAELTLMGFQMCTENENSSNIVSIQRKKVNRTLESFQGYATLDVDMDDTVAMNFNIAKWGDGGFKPNYYIENNPYACQFFFKWVAKGAKEMLLKAGLPPHCPVAKGKFEVKDFIVNYDEWPKNMVFGEFRATMKFIKNNVEIMCYQCFLSSKPRNPLG